MQAVAGIGRHDVIKRENPLEIAAWLVEAYGAEQAWRVAWDGIAQSHSRYDNYLLSVWREVKQVIERQYPAAGHSRAA